MSQVLSTLNKLMSNEQTLPENKKTGAMTSSKSAGNAWELCKRDNINSYLLLTRNKSMSNSKKLRKRLEKARSCSKSAANAPETCKRDDTNGLYVVDIEQINM